MNHDLEQGLLVRGASLEDAAACAVMLHGRGASAESIMSLAGMLNVEGVCYLAPQAPGHTWYPYNFLDDLEKNRDGIAFAMLTLKSLLERIESEGPGTARTALIGFSQGACLASEFVARHPARYGAVAALAGGLIGPPGTVFSYSGSLEGTPVFLGCGNLDPHIPRSRVEETAVVLDALGAVVETKIYQGLGHTVNDDEIERVSRMLTALTA